MTISYNGPEQVNRFRLITLRSALNLKVNIGISPTRNFTLATVNRILQDEGAPPFRTFKAALTWLDANYEELLS